MEANAWNSTPFCPFEAGWKFGMQVIGFLNGDFKERVENPKCSAAPCWIAVVAPRLGDGRPLDLRAYWTGPMDRLLLYFRP